MRFLYGLIAFGLMALLLKWLIETGAPVSEELMVFSMVLAACAGIASGD